MLEHSWRATIGGVHWCSPGNRRTWWVGRSDRGSAPLIAPTEYATGANADKGLSVAVLPTLGPGIDAGVGARTSPVCRAVALGVVGMSTVHS